MLRSITLNLQGMDDEGTQNLELVASMEKDFNKLGITLYNADGQMKSTFDILSALAEVYPRLNQNTKNYYASLIGGKTQVDVVNSILTNFTTAINANKAAMDSSGSAMKENETYVNSLQGHLSKLNSAWQELATNTVNSDFVKWLLDVGTNILEITKNTGGLVPVLTTLSGLIIMFKADKIVTGLTKFSDGIKSTWNGLKILKQHLFGAKNAEVIYMDATAGATTATNSFMLSIGTVVAAISVAIQVLNAIKQAQKEATKATVEEVKQAQEDIESKEKQIEEAKKQLKSLENEKEAYLKVSEAQKIAGDNQEYLKAKQDEIDKTQKNIDKLKEEQKEKLRSASIKAGAIETNNDAEGIFGVSMSFGEWFQSSFGGLKGYSTQLGEINEELRKYSGNIGQYKNALEDQIKKYEDIIKKKKENNEDTKIEYKVYNALQRKLNDISEDYSNAEEKAKVYYNAVKSGFDLSDIGVSEDDVRWMQQFYGLTDSQIALLKQGQDVERETVQTKLSIVKVLEDQVNAQEALRKELEYSEDDIKSLNTEIDNMQSAYSTLSSAIDEYNSSGSLSINTLQSLLSLNGDYLSALEVVNGKLQISQEYEDAHRQILQKDTLALIENAAMEDLKAEATGTAGQVAESAGAKIKAAGVDGKDAGEYAKEGAKGFNQLALSMAQAGMVDLSGVDVNAWANKWANITKTVTKMTSGIKLSSNKFTGSTSKTTRATKSTQSEYKATIDTLYKYSNALDIAKNRVTDLNKELSNTDNLEDQEKITRRLIDAINNQIQKTNDLKDAQTRQMNDYINQLRQQGFSIDYNNQSNELYINNMEHLADFSGDTAKNLENLIKKIQSLNSENVSLDGSVKDLTSNTKKYYDQLAKYPEKKLKQFKDLLKDFQQSQLDQVQNQIDDIQHAMENDPQLKALKEQLEAMKSQTDEKDKQAELEEKMLAVEKAREALENAKKNRTLQVWTRDKGWTYVADPDTIKDAQDTLKDTEKELSNYKDEQRQDELEKQIEDLEKSYQNQIDKLQDFLDEQNYQIDKANRSAIQSFEDLTNAMKKYGIDSADYLRQAKDWLDNYNKSLAEAKNNISVLAKSGNSVVYSSDIQGLYTQSMAGIEFSGVSLNNVSAVPIGNTNTSNIHIDKIELPSVTNADEFVEALKNLPNLAIANATKRK